MARQFCVHMKLASSTGTCYVTPTWLQ